MALSNALTNAAEIELMALLFTNDNWANVGDATGLRGSSAAGNFRLSLHTSDPGEAGDQTTNETSYTSYARVDVSRATGFTAVGDGTVTLAALTSFPACTGGTATITHFGLGTDASGAGNLILRGDLSPQIAVATGVTPQLTTATVIAAL